MEDLQSFKVKSSVHDYEVRFEDFHRSIKSIINEGDVIIIDKAIYDQGDRNEMKEFFYWLENINEKGLPGTHKKVVVDASEESKEYRVVGGYVNEIIESGFRRGNKIIAIGGGVVQDISGFIASILYRGVEWVFYPTTLLAQGDSCIGGKSSINFGKHKNQLGGFYPPHQIIIDTNFIKTLPDNQVTSGLGEMAHYFMIEGGEEFEFFKQLNFVNRLEEIIRRSLLIKKKMIEIDEFDKGPRLVFNYGHSFGHALESVTNYGIPHGIAVAYGMDMANFVSYKLGLVDKEFFDKSLELLKEFFGDWETRKIMIDIAGDDSYIKDKLIPALKRDKKNAGDNFGLILTRGVGNMFLMQVPSDENFESYLVEYFKERTKLI